MKKNTELFIKDAIKIHGNKYDYSKVNYVNNKTPVLLICPEHGEFMQRPDQHIHGCGCKSCGYKKLHDINVQDFDDFIQKANLLHNNKYDYSKAEYINNKIHIKIICPEHGEFLQRPDNHLAGNGCPQCGIEKSSKKNTDTTEVFIQKAQKVHGTKYDYSKVEYKNSDTKVCIICPLHGEFYITPNNHLNGNNCPRCHSSRQEENVKTILEQKGIKFEYQKSFEWLRDKKPMRYDFYLPDYNIAIECQGGQHFHPIEIFGGKENFNQTILKDSLKLQLSIEHNIKLLYYTEFNEKAPYKIYYDFETLLKENIYEI